MSRVVTIRFAVAGEGPILHSLCRASGKWEIEGLDWTFDPYPYWLVAELNGGIVGCVQVVPSVPFAFLEFLSIMPHLSHRDKAIVARNLSLQGKKNCRLMGAQFVATNIQPGLDSWARIMERHAGAVKWFDGGKTMLMRA